MSEETLTISRTEYNNLRKSSDMLDALYAAGVDNWEGFDEARSIYKEMQEDVVHIL